MGRRSPAGAPSPTPIRSCRPSGNGPSCGRGTRVRPAGSRGRRLPKRRRTLGVAARTTTTGGRRARVAGCSRRTGSRSGGGAGVGAQPDRREPNCHLVTPSSSRRTRRCRIGPRLDRWARSRNPLLERLRPRRSTRPRAPGDDAVGRLVVPVDDAEVHDQPEAAVMDDEVMPLLVRLVLAEEVAATHAGSRCLGAHRMSSPAESDQRERDVAPGAVVDAIALRAPGVA